MDNNVKTALDAACISALMHFGALPQITATLEEMGELATVLAKKLNSRRVTNEEIIDEVADVLIMAHQMRSLFGGELVDSRVLVKLEKLMDFIRSNKGAGNVETGYTENPGKC